VAFRVCTAVWGEIMRWSARKSSSTHEEKVASENAMKEDIREDPR
jgi:hypothetical protein